MPPSRAAMRPTPEVSNRALGTAEAAVSRSPTTRGSAVSPSGDPAWMRPGRVVGAAIRVRGDAGAFVAAGASTGRGTSGNAGASVTVGTSAGTAASGAAGTSNGAATSGAAEACVPTGSVTSGTAGTTGTSAGTVSSGEAGASGTAGISTGRVSSGEAGASGA